MKISGLKNYLPHCQQRYYRNEQQPDEVVLGFDAMLSQEVITFLSSTYSINCILNQSVIAKQNALFDLDEHELAMGL